MSSLIGRIAASRPWWKDYIRMTDDYTDFAFAHFIRDFLFQHSLRYIVYLRNAQTARNRLLRLYYEYKLFRLGRKFGIEIKSSTQIGEGFKMTHPYNITISPMAVLGKNINIMKGATIGASDGSHPGAPVIGDEVYIGINSTIIGGVTIGDDVLIAPNTMINRSIPSHSVVLGNPCIIVPRKQATKGYIYYKA